MCGLKTSQQVGGGGEKKVGMKEQGGGEVNECGNVLDKTGYSECGGSPPPVLTHVLLQHAAATCSTYTIQREKDLKVGVFFKGKR